MADAWLRFAAAEEEAETSKQDVTAAHRRDLVFEVFCGSIQRWVRVVRAKFQEEHRLLVDFYLAGETGPVRCQKSLRWGSDKLRLIDEEVVADDLEEVDPEVALHETHLRSSTNPFCLPGPIQVHSEDARLSEEEVAPCASFSYEKELSLQLNRQRQLRYQRQLEKRYSRERSESTSETRTAWERGRGRQAPLQHRRQ
eukprot:TRINITY_DN21400_c0_g1_i3.p1 TRINITY_DN21400_c0_g1~~TRINITY_DN21400_c0_g1_i3.p1  ORF type:complete len:216 (+),score=29.43 TRINITY_DN21400_c0_g1_i3:56-649(+)